MKRIVLLLLIVSLCLCGCSNKDADVATYTHEDLTIQLPVGFVDLSDQEVAQGVTFMYGMDPIAVNGLREEKAAFQAYGLDLDVERYGQLLIASNNVSTQLEERDGITTFTYTSGDFTYVVTLWENDDALWLVQAYCLTADYAQVKNDIWDILSSVTV